MAITGAQLSAYDEALKTVYLPAIQEQLNQDTFLADIIDTNERDVSGKNATIQCHYGRSRGTGARGDGAALPIADYQKFKTATVPMKYNYGTVEFTGPTIAATRDARGSYAAVVDTEIMGITQDLMKEVNRQLWGCGYGILARWVSTTSTTVYVIQKTYTGNTVGGDGFGSTFGAKYLKENNRAVPVVCTFSSGCTAAVVDATDIAMSSVTESVATYDTMTVTNPDVVEAAGTFYVRGDANGQSMLSIASGATGTAGYGRKEMMGLRGIVTDEDLEDIAFINGTTRGFKSASAPSVDSLQGLAVGTYTWWKAITDFHSGGRYSGQRPLTLNLMQKMFDKVEIVAGKDIGPNVMISTHALRREYFELMSADRRNVNTMQLDGGWEALDYNGVPFMVDIDAIDGEIYYLTTSELQIYRMSDYNWMQKDGSILSRVTGRDAYEGTIFRYAELGCTRRNVQGVLADLSYEN